MNFLLNKFLLMRDVTIITADLTPAFFKKILMFNPDLERLTIGSISSFSEKPDLTYLPPYLQELKLINVPPQFTDEITNYMKSVYPHIKLLIL